MSAVLELPTFRQMLVLVYQELDRSPDLLQRTTELAERVKWACARARFAYDGARVARAVDAAVFVRRQKVCR